MSFITETRSPDSTDEQKVRDKVAAFGAHAGDKPLEPMDIERRAPGPRDVQIEIAFCGVCHSDLHTVRGEWGGTLYPCVPGHEIVGHVSAVGDQVVIPAQSRGAAAARSFSSCGTRSTNSSRTTIWSE